MCSLKHCSKLENKGIDSVYLGVELLYKHIGIPREFLIERFLTPIAKHTRKRYVWKIRQDDMAFRVNCPVTESSHQNPFWDFKSQNLSLIETKGREEENEEPRRDIEFSKGIDFLGAMLEKLKEITEEET